MLWFPYTHPGGGGHQHCQGEQVPSTSPSPLSTVIIALTTNINTIRVRLGRRKIVSKNVSKGSSDERSRPTSLSPTSPSPTSPSPTSPSPTSPSPTSPSPTSPSPGSSEGDLGLPHSPGGRQTRGQTWVWVSFHKRNNRRKRKKLCPKFSSFSQFSR